MASWTCCSVALRPDRFPRAKNTPTTTNNWHAEKFRRPLAVQSPCCMLHSFEGGPPARRIMTQTRNREITKSLVGIEGIELTEEATPNRVPAHVPAANDTSINCMTLLSFFLFFIAHLFHFSSVLPVTSRCSERAFQAGPLQKFLAKRLLAHRHSFCLCPPTKRKKKNSRTRTQHKTGQKSLSV